MSCLAWGLSPFAARKQRFFAVQPALLLSLSNPLASDLQACLLTLPLDFLQLGSWGMSWGFRASLELRASSGIHWGRGTPVNHRGSPPPLHWLQGAPLGYRGLPVGCSPLAAGGFVKLRQFPKGIGALSGDRLFSGVQGLPLAQGGPPS